MPVRIQRKRTRGWKIPEDAVYVGRPTKWGNPLRVSPRQSAEYVVREYRKMMEPRTFEIRTELRGKDLACWCPLVDKNGNHAPCHADVLLEIANS